MRIELFAFLEIRGEQEIIWGRRQAPVLRGRYIQHLPSTPRVGAV
jgi:hypothetical protein